MLRIALVIAVATISGVMNSIAGGGTLLTFPALVGLGIPATAANATSTVALLPASMTSMFGYREELEGLLPSAGVFALPSLLSGAVGALLLLRTPAERFALLVPWLVLGATALFVVQEPAMRAIRVRRPDRGASVSDEVRTVTLPSVAILVYQFLVSVMAAGAMVGGYVGSRAAQRVGQRAVRLAIIVIRLGSGIAMRVGEFRR